MARGSPATETALRLRRKGETVLPSSCLRCLAAVLALWDETGHAPSYAELRDRLGFRSYQTVETYLAQLIAAGLLARGLAGGPVTSRTLRPLYRLELVPRGHRATDN
jgi:SOS-response transcriptional repressor LexA